MQGLFNRIPFFKDVSDLDFEKFERRCLWRRFEENETVVDYEDESSDVYFIVAGDVRVLIRTPAGKEIILAEMRSGEFFGELSVLDLKHRLYSELMRLSHPRAGRPGERAVTPPPYHHILAARIGCRREQVTRELSAMSAEGIVEKTRGALVILKPQVLQTRLQDALREESRA